MSVNKTLFILYGYKSNNTTSNLIPKLPNGDEDYVNEIVVGNCEYLENPNKYHGKYAYKDNPTIEHHGDMCGRYEYLGIPVFSGDLDYDLEPVAFDDIDTELLSSHLENLMVTRCQWLGDRYDVCGLLDGKLPQLHVFVEYY